MELKIHFPNYKILGKKNTLFHIETRLNAEMWQINLQLTWDILMPNNKHQTIMTVYANNRFIYQEHMS